MKSPGAAGRPLFVLAPPSHEHRGSFLEMVAEFHAAGEDWPHGANSGSRRALEDFDAYVKEADNHAHGTHLPKGWVPCSVFWLAVDRRVVGTLSLRHRLNDFLEYEGGHIGYCIRPSDCRRGYMTQFLKLGLARARGLGLRRVLITCDKTNIASAGVIQKCGGVLEDERPRRSDPTRIAQRYWIDLQAGLR